MSFSDRFIQAARFLLPTPFTIAILLTLFTLLLASVLTQGESVGIGGRLMDAIRFWEHGLWNKDLMVFAMQMMLMLVLGHSLALTKPVNNLINAMLFFCKNTASAALVVTALTVLVSLFNWGLGLIFGAIFARKIAEYAQQKNIAINYPLIGACGYSGLMVWHGGLSGSALVKVAEKGHLQTLMEKVYDANQLAAFPEQITLSETVFSPMNITVTILLLLVLPTAMYFIGRSAKPTPIQLKTQLKESHTESVTGLGQLDHNGILPGIVVAIILFVAIDLAVFQNKAHSLGFITPNFINLVLLGLAIALHGSFHKFLGAVEEAIIGAAGILIQFPLYFGIMGIMNESGLVTRFSNFFVEVSTGFTYPLYTFFSAGVVNIFVPSGGGQWAVQGPIIIQASQSLGVSLPKSIMAMAYGDQLTNMLQPFWALPLLGITGLKAKEILPYTLILMLLGIVIFSLGLMLF